MTAYELGADGLPAKIRADGADILAAPFTLQEAGKPMQSGDIVKVALEKGYWQTKGATPGATLYAAMIREVAAKGPKARFRRAEVKETKDGKAVTLRGYFTLADEHVKKNQ